MKLFYTEDDDDDSDDYPHKIYKQHSTNTVYSFVLVFLVNVSLIFGTVFLLIPISHHLYILLSR